jgi:hypothetical protein
VPVVPTWVRSVKVDIAPSSHPPIRATRRLFGA